MKKILFNLLGATSLGLGTLGAFLPLLPSTCFIFLATWSFAKSSPAFHSWLYYKSPFADSIQNWQQHRTIPYKAKWIAAFSLAVSFTITTVVIKYPVVLASIGFGMLALLTYLFTRPSKLKTTFEQQVIFSRPQELRQPVI